MTMTHIIYFVEAARCENFTQAARNLYVAQPNFSKQIAALERETGVKLFLRENRSVKLTRAGRYMYEQLREIPDHTFNAFEQARAIQREEAGKLSVGFLEGQDVNNILTGQLRRFTGLQPALELNLERGGFSQLRHGLKNGYYDLIVTLLFEVESDPELCYETLMRQQGSIAVNIKNPLAGLDSPTLSDFKNESFVVISPEESPTGYDTLLLQCSNAGFLPRIVQRATTLENMLLFVEAGLGVTLIDRNTRLSASGNVRIIPLPDSDFVDVVAVWLRENESPMIKELVQGLKPE